MACSDSACRADPANLVVICPRCEKPRCRHDLNALNVVCAPCRIVMTRQKTGSYYRRCLGCSHMVQDGIQLCVSCQRVVDTYDGPSSYVSNILTFATRKYHGCAGADAAKIALVRLFAETIPEPNSGCLLWTGLVDDDGYGSMSLFNKPQRTHRVVFVLEYGSIGSLCVCHTCDTPACMNIRHLFKGTNNDNMQDKIAKGRGARGASTNVAVLTETAVRDIRTEYALGGIGYRQLARRYSVASRTIVSVVKHLTWRHV